MEPNTFRRYGDTAAGMATAVAAAGNIDQAASVAAATPVFGLIGQEFLASFAYAQANHFTAVNQLANVFANTALAAHTAADAYSRTEERNAADFIVAEPTQP
ncbi:type VII secretion target [Nocardia macrotermitis]|uniref:type VII secretion target n=1 Tax=Nocardia macrotermitis TaxID=2585198 RepID=UPI0029E806B3|nr:type VII secretion target [Nocardia macrotermitis]